MTRKNYSQGVKIGFFLLFFLLLSGCGKPDFSPQERHQELLVSANEMIEKLNAALKVSDTVFSGAGSFSRSFQGQTTEVSLTGRFDFSTGDFSGKGEGSWYQSNEGIGNDIEITLLSEIKKSGNAIFLFPEKIHIFLGDGNIQSKFLQLIFDGLLNQRSKIEIQNSFSFFQGIPKLDPLFSGESFQVQNIGKFLSEIGPHLQYLTGEVVLSSQGDWNFKSLHFRDNNQEYFFSGSFDGKSFTGNLADKEGFLFKGALTRGKDHLEWKGKWENTYFDSTITFLGDDKYRMYGSLKNSEKKEERTEIFLEYLHKKQTSTLQTPPNDYILLEKYLEELNIGF